MLYFPVSQVKDPTTMAVVTGGFPVYIGPESEITEDRKELNQEGSDQYYEIPTGNHSIEEI